MAYTRTWNEATPPDTAAANTIAQLIRNKSIDMRERLNSVLGITDFTIDPLKGQRLDLGGVATSKIVPGATSLSLRNAADNADNLLIADAGDVTVRGKLLSARINADVVIDAAHTVTTSSPLDVSAAQARIIQASVIAAAASQAINWDTSNNQSITLPNSTTLTFSNPKLGAWYFLAVKQTGAGSFTVTWPATVKWPSDTAPTLTTTTGKSDFFSFYYNGTNYVGFLVGQAYSV